MNWIPTAVCAAACGILSAWGIGGGTLLLAVMTLFLGVDQRTAQGINLLFFLPCAGTALIRHYRAGNLDIPTLKTAVPAALAGAIAGAWAASAIELSLLRKPFGGLLLLCGLRMLLPQRRGDWVPDKE